MPPLRILVTDGNSRSALAVVRSLGRAGHWVAVGESTPGALAHQSRYCAHRVVYPSPLRHEADFVQALRGELERLAIDVLLPVADVTSMIAVSCRSEWPARCGLPLPSSAAITDAADKVGLMRRAPRLGVPIPRTHVVERPGCETGGMGLTYPVVLKPARSRVRAADGWHAGVVSYATDDAELHARLASYRPELYPIALQEKIEGPGFGVFACIVSGRLVASFAHRRLREKPPSGGVSVLCESVPMPADALQHAIALLTDLDWEGVAMVEFKRDCRDNTPRLLEINGRFWGSLQLAIDAGVDFPRILVEAHAGRGPVEPPTYRVGVQSRWFWGDVDSLLIQLFGAGSTAAGIPGGRLGVVRDFLKLWRHDQRYDNPRWDDPRPWLTETRQWIRGTR